MKFIFAGLVAATLIVGCAATSPSNVTASDDQSLDQKARQNVEAARAANIRGLELMKDGKMDESEKAFREALSIDNDFGLAHNNLGRLLYVQGKLYLAAWQFQDAIKLQPNQAEPRNNLGLVYEKVGKLNEAIDAYTRAIEIDPNDVQAIGNLARARVRRGDDDAQVRKLMDEVVERDTRPEWVDWARQWLSVTTKPSNFN